MGVLFPSAMSESTSRIKVRAVHIINYCNSFHWPFSHLLCVRGTSLLIHHTLFSSLRKLLKLWGFCSCDPTRVRAGSLSRSPGSSGWAAAARPAQSRASHTAGGWQKQNKEIFLKIRKLCKLLSPPGFYQPGFFHFSKMCTWFSVN